MKHLTIATTIALGLACVGSVGVAQDQTQTTNMQNVTVNETPQYETYVTDLHMGYGLKTLVGSTRRQYVQAQRAAEGSEALRMWGIAQQPLVAVAIDNSSGPGVARQIQLIDSTRGTVAVVNVYCKRVVPSGDKHCKLAPLPASGNAYNQPLALRQVGRLQVAEVDLRD